MSRHKGFPGHKQVGVKAQSVRQPPGETDEKKVADQQQPFEKLIVLLQHGLTMAPRLPDAELDICRNLSLESFARKLRRVLSNLFGLKSTGTFLKKLDRVHQTLRVLFRKKEPRRRPRGR